MDLKGNWNDQRVEIVIGNLLRAGVMLSAAIVVVGAAIYLVRHGHEPANYRVFAGEPNELKHIRGIMRSVAGGHGRGLIQLGLLLLIATPVARVAFSVAAFALEKDRLYIVVTLIVLGVLLLSLLGLPL